jgi:hypothetical protein
MIGMQMVRMVCSILLHVQMFPQVENGLNMCRFLIKNPGKFKGQTVSLPAIIVFIKLMSALVMQFGAQFLFLYINSEITLIKFYTQLAIIGAIEGQMANIMTATNVTGEMSTKPLQYSVKNSVKSGNSPLANAWNFVTSKTNPKWVNWFDKLTVIIVALVTQAMTLLYVTVYYYLIAFIPLVTVMYSSNFRRYPPKIENQCDVFSDIPGCPTK